MEDSTKALESRAFWFSTSPCTLTWTCLLTIFLWHEKPSFRLGKQKEVPARRKGRVNVSFCRKRRGGRQDQAFCPSLIGRKDRWSLYDHDGQSDLFLWVKEGRRKRFLSYDFLHSSPSRLSHSCYLEIMACNFEQTLTLTALSINPLSPHNLFFPMLLFHYPCFTFPALISW